MVTTALISPTTIKKPTNKPAAPIVMQRQFDNSSYSSFVIAILEPEKQSKNQISNQKLHNASDYD